MTKAQALGIEADSPTPQSGGTPKKIIRIQFYSLIKENDGLAGKSPAKLLSDLLETSKEQVELIENERNDYLYNPSKTPGKEQGIAHTQANNEASYTAALEEFHKSGLMPADGLDLDTAQTQLKEFKDGTLTQEKMAKAVKDYLNKYVDGNKEAAYQQVKLQQAFAEYESAIEKEDEELAALIFNSAAWIYSSILNSYRLGENLIQASAQAWDERIYSRRDVLLDAWKQDKTLYSELNNFSEQENQDFNYSSIMSSLGAAYQLPRLQKSLESIYNARMENFKEVKTDEAMLLKKELSDEKRDWENQMSAILARGQMEWSIAQGKLEKASDNWLKEYNSAYADQRESWETQYVLFLQNKNDWVKETTEKSVKIGDEQTLLRFGASAKEAIARSSGFIMTDLPAAPDTKALTERILAEGSFSSLLETAESLNTGIENLKPVMFTRLGKNPYVTSKTLDKIRKYQTEQNDELKARMALVQYERLLDNIADAIKNLEETVEDSNENYANSMKHKFLNAGFVRKGKNFYKRAMVASTLWDTYYTDHTIEGYKYYVPKIMDVASKVEPADEHLINVLDASGIDALFDKATGLLEAEQERIFGGESRYIAQTATEKTEYWYEFYRKVSDRDGKQWVQTSEYMEKENVDFSYGKNSESRRVNSRSILVINPDENISEEDFIRLQKEWEEAAAEEQQMARYIEVQGGEFNAHIGYMPQFKPVSELDSELSLGQWEKNVRFQGDGEMGRMMGLLQQHKLIENAALAEFNKPFYEKKLWNDRGIDFKAITLRSAVDIYITTLTAIATTAATVATFGAAAPTIGFAVSMAAASLAVNLADDLLFTTADVGTGYRSAEDAFGDFGTKALTSLATSAVSFIPGISAAADTALTTVQKLGNILIEGGKSLLSQTASSFISAIDFSDKDGDGDFFEEERIAQGFDLGSIATSMISSAVTLGFDTAFSTGDFGKALTDFSSKHQSFLGDLSSTAGSLVNAGLTYAMKGETTINLLNTSMFGGPNVGLLELKLSKDGISGTIGMGGVDLNVGKVFNAMRGINVAAVNQRSINYERKMLAQYGGNPNSYANPYSTRNVNTLGSGIRRSYSYGDAAARRQANRIFSGRDKVVFDRRKGEAETVADKSGSRTIFINANHGSAQGDSAKSMLGIILAHEAHRDGRVSGKTAQELETQNAVKAHVGLAENMLLDGRDMSFMLENPQLAEEFIAYQKSKASGNMDSFDEYIDENYDSSADYWKLVEKEGRLILEYDGSDDVYDKDGNLLAASSKESANLYNTLKVMKDLGMADSAEYKSKMEQYKKVTAVKNDGFTFDRVLSRMMGLPAGSKSDLMALQNIPGYDNALKDLEAQARDIGGVSMTRGYVWQTGTGKNKKAGYGDNFAVDVTDIAAQFQGAALQGFYGNENYVSNQLFTNMHDPYLSEMTIAAAQNYVRRENQEVNKTPQQELNQYDNALDVYRDLAAGNSASDSYTERLLNESNNYTDELMKNVNTAANWTFESQNDMSRILDWGFIEINGNKVSSLCNAAAILEAMDLNYMQDTSLDNKTKFLNQAKSDGLIFDNGWVKDPTEFAKRYTENVLRAEISDNQSIFNTGRGNSRFGVGFSNQNGTHFTVIDYNRNDNSHFWNPWTIIENGNRYGENFDYKENKRWYFGY